MAASLARAFYDRDAAEVAPELLNKVLIGHGVAARLIEVEAYRAGEDPGSHAYRGQTQRNASMFAKPGTLYVYFSYGVHWCMNAVCGPGDQAHAVLLRAAEPLQGIETMYERRIKAKRDRDLLSGPGKLTQAFAVTGADDGTNLVRGGPLKIVDDGIPPPAIPHVTKRIGLGAGKGDDLLLRFTVVSQRS